MFQIKVARLQYKSEGMMIILRSYASLHFLLHAQTSYAKEQKIADTETATLNAGLNTMYEITCQQYYLFFACKKDLTA